MWWLDRNAIEIGEKLRDTLNIKEYVESGTFRGINLKFWAYRFDRVIGIEIDQERFWQTGRRLNRQINAEIICKDSSQYLGEYVDNYYRDGRIDTVLIYLDAHFYTPGEKKTQEDRWVVLRELKALEGFKNCVLVIHDFNCEGLYGLVYDGEPLDFALVKDELAKVNPDFSYYNNIREHCKPHTEESIVGVEGINPDYDTLETIRYHHSDKLKYRGILYCVPRPIDLCVPRPIDLKEYKLSLLIQ